MYYKGRNAMLVTLRFRVTKKEANKIRGLAKIYAGGDVSKWLRHAGLNADRKYLVKRTRKKGKKSKKKR